MSNKIKLAEKIIAYIIVIIIIFTSGVFVGKKTATAAQTDISNQEQQATEENNSSMESISEDMASDSEDIDTNVSSSTDVDRCPQSEIISMWGEVLPELRQPRVWDGQRAKDLAARWKSKDVKANSVDYWRGLFEYIRRSDFLMGRVTNFSASLDWVVKASNYNKIIEGKYHE